MAQHIFGPVPSRRLGFSLGVDIIPHKHCCYDCIYCQIGKTTNIDLTRKAYLDPDKLLEEIAQRINTAEKIDYITFSGSGEPTLNSNLGLMILGVKKITSIPVAVITNGALLYQADVRKDLINADVVLPSLDAASEDIFRYVNRPNSLLDVETVILGLKDFRKEYNGKIWLEIMLIKDVNDDEEEIKKFERILSNIEVDKIQLNTVTRPPSEETTGSLAQEDLEKICHVLGPKCEIICSFEKSVSEADENDWSVKILEILKRRSLTLEDIMRITGVSYYTAKNRLQVLENEGQIKSYFFHDNIFYMKN